MAACDTLLLEAFLMAGSLFDLTGEAREDFFGDFLGVLTGETGDLLILVKVGGAGFAGWLGDNVLSALFGWIDVNLQ